MRNPSFIVITALLFLYSCGAYADMTSASLQESLDRKILEMDALVAEMEEESDGWKLRSIMQKHAQLMEASANLASETVGATYSEGDGCLKKAAGEEDLEYCCISDNIQNSQYKLLVVLMQHVIQRQNIILEKTGLFK